VQRFCWLAALALAAAVAARGARDVRRAVALAAAGVTAVLAASAAVQGQPVLLQVGTLVIVALALALAAGWRLGLADEVPLGVAAVVGALAAGVFAAESLDMTVPLAVALGSAWARDPRLCQLARSGAPVDRRRAALLGRYLGHQP
jgi:hypothetical protein